jgi:hypothetical protein
VLKCCIGGGLAVYAAVVTVAVLKMEPKVLLIGIDGKNTRIITNDNDALLESEKINFVFGFLDALYAYDQTTFDRKSKDAKKRMSAEVWKQKKGELEGIERKIRNEGLNQAYEIDSLKEVDKYTYVAELRLKIDRRSIVTETPLKVKMKLRKRARDAEIPYPIEVEVLSEVQG